MANPVVHNKLEISETSVVKNFGCFNGIHYALAAKSFSHFFQYFIFGKYFFEWPLAFSPATRAEREWIYQQGLSNHTSENGDYNGIELRIVEFKRLSDSKIEMEKVEGYVDLFELLGNPESINERDTLARTIQAYGAWVADLYNHGIMPLCNHPGNVMVNQEDYSKAVLIDFENYIGDITQFGVNLSKEQLNRHRLIKCTVDPVTALALDIGVMASLKIPIQEKLFYQTHFKSGFVEVYEGDLKRLHTYLEDRRLSFLGFVRGVFYDVSHAYELRKAGLAISYFIKDYSTLKKNFLNSD